VVYGHNRYPAVRGSTRQACCLLDGYYDNKDNTYYVKASGRIAQSCAFCLQHFAANMFQNLSKKCSNLRSSKYVVCAVSWLTLCSPRTGACRRKPRSGLIITSVFCSSICNILILLPERTPVCYFFNLGCHWAWIIHVCLWFKRSFQRLFPVRNAIWAWLRFWIVEELWEFEIQKLLRPGVHRSR